MKKQGHQKNIHRQEVGAGPPSHKNPDVSESEMSGQFGAFVPSERQLHFLRTFLNWETPGMTVSALCKKVGIARDTYYAWRSDPKFVAWFNSYRKRQLDEWIMHIDRALVSKAIAGDLQAARLVYELRGELHNRLDASLKEAPRTIGRADAENLLKLMEGLGEANKLSGVSDETNAEGLVAKGLGMMLSKAWNARGRG